MMSRSQKLKKKQNQQLRKNLKSDQKVQASSKR